MLVLERPAEVMRPIAKGLSDAGMAVLVCSKQTTADVIDDSLAHRADAVVAISDGGDDLAKDVSLHVHVICLVPFDRPSERARTAVAKLRLPNARDARDSAEWSSLLRLLDAHRGAGTKREDPPRILLIKRPADVMTQVELALRADGMSVSTYPGFDAAEVREELARRNAELVVAYADIRGLEIAQARIPIVLVLDRDQVLATLNLDADVRALTTFVRTPQRATFDLTAKHTLQRLRRTVEWSARSRRYATASPPADSYDRPAAPVASGPPRDVRREQHDLEMRIRAQRLSSTIKNPTFAEPIHVDAGTTVNPRSRTIDEILDHDESSFSFVQRYGTLYDGVPAKNLPDYVRRKLLEATNESPGATEALAIDALQSFASDGDQLRRTVESILKTRADLSPTLKGHCAKVLRRLGDRERARALLEGITAPDARVLAADIAEERGELDRALSLAEGAAGARLETLGATERVARWREAIFAPAKPPKIRSVVPLRVRGEPWTIVFDDAPILGRTDASITVAAPVISRKHLSFKRVGDVPEVTDLGSQHGTYFDGVRLAGSLRVDRARELRLAGSISCVVRPGDADEGGTGALVVDVADRRWLLVFGGAATLGGTRFERVDDKLVVRDESEAVVEPSRTSEVQVEPEAFEP